MTNTYNPNYTSSPGETMLELFMLANITSLEFADAHSFSRAYIQKVIKGRARMVPRLRKALYDDFGADELFWYNRDKNYWDWIKKIEAR